MRRTIKLLADRHTLLSAKMLPEEISLHLFDPDEGLPDTLGSFDALFIRTVTPINRATLPERPGRLAWIGSATAGHDHADREWLAELGIEFAWSPGCNAQSVAEYVAAAVLIWADETGSDLQQISAGIAGAGLAGRATADLLNRLGLRTLLYDPPRQERDETFVSATLEDILACDLLTVHTSLEEMGAWPSYHWLDSHKLDRARFRLLINAARGGVVRDDDLLQALTAGRVESAVLDVWEGEPLFNRELARRTRFATPHIAGYSTGAKTRASNLLVGSLCHHFQLQPDSQQTAPLSGSVRFQPDPHPWNEPGQYGKQDQSGPPGSGFIHPGRTPSQGSLRDLILQLHPIGNYDRLFRQMIDMSDGERRRRFQEIRTGYPLRQEFDMCSLPAELLEDHPELKILGVQPEKTGR